MTPINRQIKIPHCKLTKDKHEFSKTHTGSIRTNFNKYINYHVAVRNTNKPNYL